MIVKSKSNDQDAACSTSFSDTPETNRAWNILGDDNAEGAWRKAQQMERERNALRRMLVRIYNQGYCAGHHDTVDGEFVPIHSCDMDTYHSDVVAEILEENAERIHPEPTPQDNE